MNNKTNKINNKPVFIVLLLFVSVIVLFFTSKNSVYGAFAATVDNSQPENSQLNTNEEIRTYTVNVYNGSEGIDAFQISAGDTYSLSQYGYTINNVYTDFTGREKMNNCAYGSYYGIPNVDGSTIATYSGWMINGSLIANNGQWSDYESLIVTIDAKWEPIVFTATLHDGYSDSYVTQSFNYFDGFTIPTRTRTGYEFRGWLANDGTLYDGDTVIHLANNIDLIAQWEEIFEVRLISNEHRSYNRTWEGSIGDTFTLPSLTSGYFYVSQWGTYQVGSEYTIMGNVTLYAVWKGNTYTVTYENLTFMGRTASIICDDYMIDGTSTTYEYGVGFDLTRVRALWIRNNRYDIYLKFLGWYTNKEFTTKVPGISPTEMGNKTYYAKWRYDAGRLSRGGTYTITDVDPYTEEYRDNIHLGLKSKNLYQELKGIGIKYIYLEFKLQIREINDGYQEVLIYKDTSPTSNPIWSLTNIEHDPGGTNTTPAYYIWTCTFSIDDLKDCNFLYVRYGAHGFGADTWVTERLYVDRMYTATENSDEDVEEFTWDYSADVKDEDCISLNT